MIKKTYKIVTPKKGTETIRMTERKETTTDTITIEGEMTAIANAAENRRTQGINVRQEIQIAIFAGFQGTGRESARKRGRTGTITTEGEDTTTITTTTKITKIITTITKITTVIATIVTTIIGTINSMTIRAEVGAHHHITQEHTARTNNQ